MGNHIYMFVSVAGPKNSVEAWVNRIIAARQTVSDGKGSHWGEAFGLFDAYCTIEPKLNDARLSPKPPTEAYATLIGYWLGRHWSATEVGLPLGTISSLFPDLEIYFCGDHYEEQGMRGLWINGECVVFDVYDPEDNHRVADQVDRRVRSKSPIPEYYAPLFEASQLPDCVQLRQSIDGEQKP